MDQYMALSKKDLAINITLNELYNTQSLLVQHLDSLVRCRAPSPRYKNAPADLPRFCTSYTGT